MLKKHQPELEELAEENRLKLAEATLTEIELQVDDDHVKVNVQEGSLFDLAVVVKVSTDGRTVHDSTAFEPYRVDPSQVSSMSMLPSLAIKVSATTTCPTIASRPSVSVVTGVVSTRCTAPATWFGNSAVPAIVLN